MRTAAATAILTTDTLPKQVDAARARRSGWAGWRRAPG